MKLSVCELPDEGARRAAAWSALVRFLEADPTDVLVLPELPFSDWRTFRSRTIDPAAWQAACAEHAEMLARFGELRAACVLSTQPVEIGGKRFNQAFAWTREGGARPARAKHFLPEEPDGWEATWFARGARDFTPLSLGPLTVGFQICTELLFSDAAHEIGRGGGQLIAAPRASSGHRRWPMAAGLAAVMSGCFVASSNRRSHDDDSFPGRSWIVSPEGELLAETSAAAPFATVEVDLAEVARAKGTYPRSLVIS